MTAPTASIVADVGKARIDEMEVDHRHSDTADDCSEAPSEPVLKPGSTVMLIGDSLASGMSEEFRNLAKKNGYRPVTHSIVGSTTKTWKSLVVSDLKVHKPSLLVVSLGTNDAAGFNDVERNPNVFLEFMRAADSTDAFVVWIGPPAITSKRLPRLDEVRSLIKTVAPIYFPSEDVELDLFDGIHTNAVGYRFWIRHIWSWMSKSLLVYSTE
jgi:lysophospholipase L1-like esterase